jgi:hypothetical protein
LVFVLVVVVVELVESVLLAVPVPACANERVAPSSMANAIVSSFFIQSPSAVSVFGIIQSCKELLCNILSREAEEMEALFEAPKKAACLRPLYND